MQKGIDSYIKEQFGISEEEGERRVETGLD